MHVIEKYGKQNVSDERIKCPDKSEMIWANTFIVLYLTQHAIGLVIYNLQPLNTRLNNRVLNAG